MLADRFRAQAQARPTIAKTGRSALLRWPAVVLCWQELTYAELRGPNGEAP